VTSSPAKQSPVERNQSIQHSIYNDSPTLNLFSHLLNSTPKKSDPLYDFTTNEQYGNS
jgi:hypothetical protein